MEVAQDKYIKREFRLNLPADRSAFLWGPRKTGKTSLLRHRYNQAFWLDLLDYDLYLRLSQRPTLLTELVARTDRKLIIIDEVQKIPMLMDEIHRLIENKKYQFILSSSSARKLKRSDMGMLGGRAWRFELYPFVTKEIGTSFDLSKALYSGFIPSHFLASDPFMDLKAYVMDYLKEEIQAEALSRNLPAFSAFLKSAALTNGMLLNYSNAARDAGVSVKTIREYYQILEDTLIGRRLSPWKKSNKRRLIETEKFYFFDTGIVCGLLNYKSLTPGTREYGRAFEHFIIQECWSYSHYSRLDFPIHFWRTASGSEVDLILGNADVVIEIKSSDKISGHLKGIHLFKEEFSCGKKMIVSRDPIPRKLSSGIECIHWTEFCQKLWNGDLIK